MERDSGRIALAAVVVLHLIVAVTHGVAHGGAGVQPGWASLVFILVVIQAAPLVGLAWMWRNPLSGARLIGFAMAASLLFGVVNHFIIPGADRVDHVTMAWRGLFGSTAAMLAVTEAAGMMLGFSYRRTAVRRTL
jgi:hypothetical protein